MSSSPTPIEIVVQAKDLVSEAIESIKKKLNDIPEPINKINEAFKTLKILPTTEVETQKAKIIAAFEEIKKSGTASAEEIQRAEAAKNRAISDLMKATNSDILKAENEKNKAITDADENNISNRKNLLTSLKEHWMAVTAAVVGAWMTAQKAMEFAEIGAQALQAEEAFRNVTQSYEVDGDRLLAKMKEVSAGTIDESNLMQAAMRALQQGLNPDQIVSLMEVARSSARIAGTDIATAFEKISEAAANQMTKGLKSMGIVIDNAKAFEEYARQIGKAKEALTEQEQSQAIANAAIAEGMRQREKMGPLLINENEQMQIYKTRIEELKETVGKGLVVALGLAAENIEGIGFALSATAIMNAPAAIKAIIAQIETLSVASGTASMAMKASLSALAAFIGYELGGAVDKVLYKLTNIDLSGMNEPLERTANATQELNEMTARLNSKLAELGLVGPDALKRYNAGLETGNVLTDAATGKVTNLLELLKQSIALMGAQIQTLQMSSQFEMELIKKDFDTGKITMEQYLDFIKKKQGEITEAQIAEVQKRIEETKKEYQMKMISEDEMKSRLLVLNEDIKKIRLQAISDSQHAYDEAIKTVEENSKKVTEEAKKAAEEAKKEQQEEFDNWTALQDLKLQAMKAQYDLEGALDDAAVKAGILRESTAMQNKLDRLQQVYDEQLRMAEEMAEKEAALYGVDSQEYAKAIAAKEQLQQQYAQTIIESEANITEKKKQEEKEALEFISEYADVRIKLAEKERDEKLKKLQEYYDQSKIDALEYQEAVTAIEKEFSQKREEIERTEFKEKEKAQEGWVVVTGATVQKIQDLWEQAFGHDLPNLFEIFGNYMIGEHFAITNHVGDMLDELASIVGGFTSITRDAMYEFNQTVKWNAWDAYIDLAEFVIRTKELMGQLKDAIMSYRLQLMQLRGDRMGELEWWRKQEKEKLEEQYKDLAKTAEYYEALALIDELYAEKKKKILDDLRSAQETNDEQTSGGSGGGSGGSSGSNPSSVGFGFPSLEEFAAQMRENFTFDFGEMALQATGGGAQGVEQAKTININMNLTSPSYDPQSTERWVSGTLYPILQRTFKIRGLGDI